MPINEVRTKSRLSLNVIFILVLILSLMNFDLTIMSESVVLTASDAPEPLFHVHISAPPWRPVRAAYAHRMERELESIGISCDADLICWSHIRIFPDAPEPSNEGGYDMTLVVTTPRRTGYPLSRETVS